MKIVNAVVVERLIEYARLTAADMGVPWTWTHGRAAAIRAMRDEPGEVAAEVGCDVEVVMEWCREVLAALDTREVGA